MMQSRGMQGEWLSVWETEARRMEGILAERRELVATTRKAIEELGRGCDEEEAGLVRLADAVRALRGEAERQDSEPAAEPTQAQDPDEVRRANLAAGRAIGRAKAAEPVDCPGCGRAVARNQLSRHHGSTSCLAAQQESRDAERAAVLAAPATVVTAEERAPLKLTMTVGESQASLVACDLCGRHVPSFTMRRHRGGRPCIERQAATKDEAEAERARKAAAATPAAPVAPAVPARPRRAEDIPSMMGGRPVAPGELRGVAAGMTRSIAAAPERVASGGAAKSFGEASA